MPFAPTTSFVATYDRSGQALSLFHSEPVRRIAITSEQSSTTGENNKDKVTLSESGIEKSRQPDDSEHQSSNSAGASSTDQQKTPETQAKNTTQELTPTEEKAVQQLKARDREVKSHEMTHLANAGQYARDGATYSYQQGPDGRRYAVGGEVPIDVSKEKTPEQTIRKMEAIKRAAMAPAEPSSADRSIAATAAATELLARQELQTTQAETAAERKDSESDDLAADEKQTGRDEAANEAVFRTPLDIVA